MPSAPCEALHSAGPPIITASEAAIAPPIQARRGAADSLRRAAGNSITLATDGVSAPAISSRRSVRSATISSASSKASWRAGEPSSQSVRAIQSSAVAASDWTRTSHATASSRRPSFVSCVRSLIRLRRFLEGASPACSPQRRHKRTGASEKFQQRPSWPPPNLSDDQLEAAHHVLLHAGAGHAHGLRCLGVTEPLQLMQAEGLLGRRRQRLHRLQDFLQLQSGRGGLIGGRPLGPPRAPP